MHYTMLGDLKIPKIAVGTWAWGANFFGKNKIFGTTLEKTDLKQVGFCFEDHSSLRMAQRILVDLARLLRTHSSAVGRMGSSAMSL